MPDLIKLRIMSRNAGENEKHKVFSDLIAIVHVSRTELSQERQFLMCFQQNLDFYYYDNAVLTEKLCEVLFLFWMAILLGSYI